MPKPKKGARLGGSPAHQRLILSNLATALFEHGRITTTEAKARTLRPYAEKLITKAKRGRPAQPSRGPQDHPRQGRRAPPLHRDRADVRRAPGRLHPDHQDRSPQGRQRPDGRDRAGDRGVQAVGAEGEEEAEPAEKARARPRPPRRPRSRRPPSTRRRPSWPRRPRRRSRSSPRSSPTEDEAPAEEPEAALRRPRARTRPTRPDPTEQWTARHREVAGRSASARQRSPGREMRGGDRRVYAGTGSRAFPTGNPRASGNPFGGQAVTQGMIASSTTAQAVLGPGGGRMAAEKPEFDDFVAARSTALLRTAYLLTHDHALAEDLLQTALTKSWFAWRPDLGATRRPTCARCWSTRIASWWRRRWNGEHATAEPARARRRTTRPTRSPPSTTCGRLWGGCRAGSGR